VRAFRPVDADGEGCWPEAPHRPRTVGRENGVSSPGVRVRDEFRQVRTERRLATFEHENAYATVD
jgi:hypothetical protein